MNARRHFTTAAIGFVLVVTTGIIGYMTIEGWSFFDSLYMTIITISTVGFGEVHVLSTAGRAFNIFLVIGGASVMLYTLTAVVQYILEGQFVKIWGRHRMKDKISKLQDHVILCGYGLVGREVARVFKSESTPFVVIESNPQVVAMAAQNDYLVVEGNATSDEVLEEAGIDKAKALVTALGTDADNVYVVLSARQISSNLYIVARSSTVESEPKLQRAGADRTMSPYNVGGRRMAMLTLRPVVVDFIDTTMRIRGGNLVLENVRVSSESPVNGRKIEDSQDDSRGATILAIQKRDGVLLTNPPKDSLLEVGDEVVAIGTREQLRYLEGTS